MSRFLPSPMPALVALLLVLAAAAWLPAVAAAQAPALYDAAQAEAGKRVFETSCAMCHGTDLLGKDDAPPIVGAYFASSWGGHPVSQLLEFVKREMPFSAPGSLNEDSYLKVVSYVLSMNGVPAGPTPLAMSATGVITVTVK